MHRIKVGVVGAGHLGTYHLQKYDKLSAVEILGVADVIEERAKDAGDRYGCRSFVDYRDLIGLVDVVSVAVPTAFHFEVAKTFLDAGVDVLLEKPIATTVDEAKALIEIARSKGLIFQIGFVERFNPAILALEKVMSEPLFIEAHRLHPFLPRGTDVDVILDLMIHDLDIIIKFVQSPLEHVAAVGVNVISDRVDIANARLTFKNGCVANITASRVTGKKMQKVRFFSANGYHAVDYAKRELISVTKKGSGRSQGDIIPNKVDIINHDPLEEEIRAFLNAVTQRSLPPVSGEDALPSLQAAVEIIDKMKTVKESREF